MPQNHEQGRQGVDDIKEEEFHLQELQARQEIILKKHSDVFRKALASLHGRHLEQSNAYEEGQAPQPPEWEPPIADGTDNTRLSVAISDGRSKEDRQVIKSLKIFFDTPVPDNPRDIHVYRRLTVAVGQTYDGLDTILPLEPFNNDDIVVVAGLLDEMRKAKDKGKLPHLKDNLAELGPIQEPPAAT
jgi:hypothetical protein